MNTIAGPRYYGDVLLREMNGDIESIWQDGQPHMTDGFETAVLISVFGNRHTWQNAIADTPQERIVSRFPEITDRASVSEATKNDGTEALREALGWLTAIGAAESVEITGRITSVRSIGWSVEITRPGDATGSRFLVNWDEREGVLLRPAQRDVMVFDRPEYRYMTTDDGFVLVTDEDEALIGVHLIREVVT